MPITYSYNIVFADSLWLSAIIKSGECSRVEYTCSAFVLLSLAIRAFVIHGIERTYSIERAYSIERTFSVERAYSIECAYRIDRK